MNVWIPLALLVFMIVTVFIRMKARAKERIREISGDIFRVVKRELKHQKQKLPRLLKELK